MKVPVVIRPQYTIWLEAFDGQTFVHCDVREWGAKVARHMSLDMDRLREMQGRDMYAINEPTGCKKHQRFMRMMGFSYFCDVASTEGLLHVFKR